MLKHVVAPDINHKRDMRLDPRDVGEVLIRADAEVSAARDVHLFQLVEDVLIGEFVRDQIIRTEVTTRFREARIELPEINVRARLVFDGLLRPLKLLRAGVARE